MFTKDFITEVWVRTCQECGHKQTDIKPTGKLSDAYQNRKCKKCKSEALDYGMHMLEVNGKFEYYPDED